MKKIIIACVIIASFSLANQTSTVEAARFRFHFGGGGVRVGVGHGHHGGWHNTSHYDWHPGYYRRHRNHYHYMPGHYDYHRTGHWNYHCW